VQEIVVPVYRRPEPDAAPKPPLLATRSDEELLGVGVPPEWLADVKQATEDTLLALVDHLPAEAAEAVLELATGGVPRPVRPAATVAPFEHPDALRRFRVMTNVEELERALAFPWDKWAVFLHPDQRELVERDWQGPARVSGAAGTGKTIVALHRAAHLARRHPDARVLLTTFSDTLAHALRTQLRRLLGNEPRLAERIDVYSLDALGLRLHTAHLGAPAVAGRDVVTTLMREAAGAVDGHRFGMPFLMAEWDHVVDAWQLDGWEAYRDVARLGRRTRLPERQRALAWAIFERVRAGLRERRLVTRAEVFTRLAAHLSRHDARPFDFAVVDEAQDLGIPHVRFFAALAGRRPDALFFAGDLGQRIFQQPFSWKALGVDVRGRSRTLRVCYRTSHQIRTQADRLLGATVSDVDGNAEPRTGTVSVFNGPPPTIRVLANETEEIAAAGAWIAERLAEGVLPHELGVFVRSVAQLDRARAAARQANARFGVLDDHVETRSGHVSIGTMHLAKGLEFRAVAVMACDDDVVPLQERIESVGDHGDLREVYETERHLLYVACTRARDHLLVTSVEPGSEFLDDLRDAGTRMGSPRG
jgi:superfamily I DNA/RNA helicase